MIKCIIYTVAYPQKFKGGGGGARVHTRPSPWKQFFLWETIFVMWEPFGYFLYYAIMGTLIFQNFQNSQKCPIDTSMQT